MGYYVRIFFFSSFLASEVVGEKSTIKKQKIKMDLKKIPKNKIGEGDI